MWIPPVYSPFSPADAVRAAFARGTRGAADLRRDLLDRFGGRTVHLFDSGTSALRLALEVTTRPGGSLDRPGAAALPAFGCYDLITAAVGAGAPVVFYDVDPRTLGPVPESFRRAVERSSVVIAANLYGLPLDWEGIRSIADEYGRLVIEDAAQGLGAISGGRASGSLGDLSILSFGRGKGWTGGGGGALLDRRDSPMEPDLPDASSSRLKTTLATLAVWLLARPSAYGVPARLPALRLGETRYRPPVPPTRIHPSHASLALASADVALCAVEERRRVAATLALRWEALGGRRPDASGVGAPSYLRLPIYLDRPPARGSSAERALRRYGIYRSYPRTLPDVARERGVRVDASSPREMPGADYLARHLATVPTHQRTPIEAVLRGLETAGLAPNGPSGHTHSGRPAP